MDALCSVHRIADGQSPLLNAVGEELAVVPVDRRRGIPRRAGRKLVRISFSSGWKKGPVLVIFGSSGVVCEATVSVF